MHPGFMNWWQSRRGGACGQQAGWGGGEHRAEGCGGRWQHGGDGGGGGAWAQGGGHDDDFGGGAFGVRRPLRFLAFKLELDEKQVAELAKVLSELKTERAQAAVDHRRTTAALADAIASETFDAASAEKAAGERVKSAERLRDAVVKALAGIHALLVPVQRDKLAYLIRTGALGI